MKNSHIFKFIFVGVINTVFGTVIMFVMYNIFNFSYFLSTLSNYFFGSILSFFLNKFYTFNNRDKNAYQTIKFIMNILNCYFFAYVIPKYLFSYIFNTDSRNVENIFMVVGMFLFVTLNFIGQKYFVFRKEKS